MSKSLKDCALYYLDGVVCQGPDGGSVSLETDRGLPSATQIGKAVAELPPTGGNAALLIKDDLLHPLRVDLEEKVPEKELPQYLLWKLKRFLPYPVDQMTPRYLPLNTENAYLAFCLPTSWLQGVHEAFGAMDIHCGYMGGLFTTLLEQRDFTWGRTCIALFGDCYLAARRDDKGGYHELRTRRLPFLPDGGLDTRTLAEADLAPLVGQPGDDQALLLNFAPTLDDAAVNLRAQTGAGDWGRATPTSALMRFDQYLRGKEARS